MALLPDGHLDYLKSLTRLTDYQKGILELYEKQEKTTLEEKKLRAFIQAEKATIRANRAKLKAQKLVRAEKTKEQEIARKARTKRLIELGALFDIANLGHHDPATLVGLLSSVKIASDDPRWLDWHQKGVTVLQELKQAKNGN